MKPARPSQARRPRAARAVSFPCGHAIAGPRGEGRSRVPPPAERTRRGGRPGRPATRPTAPSEPERARNVRLRVLGCGARRADRRPRRETKPIPGRAAGPLLAKRTQSRGTRGPPRLRNEPDPAPGPGVVPFVPRRLERGTRPLVGEGYRGRRPLAGVAWACRPARPHPTALQGGGGNIQGARKDEDRALDGPASSVEARGWGGIESGRCRPYPAVNPARLSRHPTRRRP